MATNNKRKHVPHSAIFEYWKDKKITESGKVLSMSEDTNERWMCVVEDDAKPSCWACGLPVDTTIDGTSDLKKVWNRAEVTSELHRCHIHPHALGGKGEPCNLFLMCRMCHNDSPDTTNPATFIRWVFDRRCQYIGGYRNPGLIYADLKEACDRRGIDLFDLFATAFRGATSFTEADKAEMDEYIYKNMVTHGFKKADESGRSSLVETTVDWLVHKYVGKVLE